MKLFFDTEMTGLHLNTTIISLGIVSEDDKTFYAEFTDYMRTQVDEWIQKNVIDNLKFNSKVDGWFNFEELETGYNVEFRGNSKQIKYELKEWLKQFDEIEFCNDCLGYDNALLSQLLGKQDSINPEDNYYYPHSLCLSHKIIPIEYETLVEARTQVKGTTHNSLHDAMVMKKCYEKTMEMV